MLILSLFVSALSIWALTLTDVHPMLFCIAIVAICHGMAGLTAFHVVSRVRVEEGAEHQKYLISVPVGYEEASEHSTFWCDHNNGWAKWHHIESPHGLGHLLKKSLEVK